MNQPFSTLDIVIEVLDKSRGDIVVIKRIGGFAVYIQIDGGHGGAFHWELESKCLSLAEAMTRVAHILTSNVENDFYVEEA